MRADLARAPEVIAARRLTLGAHLSYVETTESTNDDAKRGARAGAPHGAVWVAEAQTRGRGRQGRAWLSEAGEGLLFSVLLRVACSPARVPPLALVAGLAVRDAVAAALADDAPPNARVLVKWPNDVVVGARGVAKKVAGILVESAVVADRTSYVVVGVGVNVLARELPPEIARDATSIARERGDGPEHAPLDRAVVLADILAALERDASLTLHRGLGPLRERLLAFDALAGERVAGGGVVGAARGIDAEGHLIVERDDGVRTRIVAGEVHLQRLRDDVRGTT